MEGAVSTASASLFVFPSEHLPAERAREEEEAPREQRQRGCPGGRRLSTEPAAPEPGALLLRSPGSRGGAGRGTRAPAFPGTSRYLPVPARAPSPERGHGLPAEPPEQPGGGERRGALPRAAGERPRRLPPLVPAPAPAEAARGAAESLARALRAESGVAAGDPGHHPGAQAGARRAHPPAAEEGTCGGVRDAGCGVRDAG